MRITQRTAQLAIRRAVRARRRSSTPTARPRQTVFSYRLFPIIRTLILRTIRTLILRIIRTLILRIIRTIIHRSIRTGYFSGSSVPF